MNIRFCDLDADRPLLLDLWAQSMGPDWPISAGWLLATAVDPQTYLPGDHLLAEEDGLVLGFVLTRMAPGLRTGSLLALGVRPDHRRRGLGRALHLAALTRLLSRGAAQFQLGSGAEAYFWPGVPLGLPGAWEFFAAQGWPRIESSFDLVRGLVDYTTPAWVWERVRGIEFLQAGAADAAVALEMVQREETGWLSAYSRVFEEGRSEDVLLALAGGRVLGVCLVESGVERWAARFAQPVGAPACVLTEEASQGRGIGTALVARANEILQTRGCKTSFIGWTWLVDWYAKLGYQVWQENIMSWTVPGNSA